MEEKDRLLGRILSIATPAPWDENIEMARESAGAIAADLGKIRYVCFIGAGTSLYACLVGKSYMEKIGGVRAEALPCHAFHRYAQEALLGGGDCMVVGMSHTGKARSVEMSLKKARDAGALAVAISGYPDRPAPMAAEYIIRTDPTKEGAGCKTVAYVQELTATFELALAVGRANGTLGAEKEAYWHGQLDLTVEKARELAGLKDQIFALAEQYKDAAIHYVIGSGPNQGTAEEGALMNIEMGWVLSQAEELEDFHHGRYRAVDEKTPLLYVVPKGGSTEKLIDMLGAAKEIDAPTIVLTDDDNPLIAKLARHVVRMPSGIDEYMTPFLYIMPLFLYGHHLGVARGTDPSYNRYGFVPTAYRFADHYDAEGNLVVPAKPST